MRLFIFLLGLLLFHTGYGQIDQRKLDSLAHSIDSSAKAFQTVQDSFVKVQDSIYHSVVNDNSQRDHSDEERRIHKHRQQLILRILVVSIFILGIVMLLRRRKTKSN